MNRAFLRSASCLLVLAAMVLPAAGQGRSDAAAASSAPAAVVPLPPDYVIGVDDVLGVLFWKDPDLTTDVVVRPDGKISVPLLNDVHAAGLTPEGLAEVLEKNAREFVNNPDATVIVRSVQSRRIYVVGEVARPGTVLLTSEMNVLQLIAAVGGFQEHANRGNVTIIRTDNGRERWMRFNYNDVIRGRNLEQNITLRPGDTVLVR